MVRRVLFTVALVLAVSAVAFAQTGAGSIRGYVKDEQGGILPGVTVTATSPDALSPASAVTGSDGYYRLINLPPGTYAVTCFCIQPERRRRGLARALLAAVLADLRRRGVRRLEAFPRPGQHEDGEVWTGPLGLYLAAGFRIARDDPRRPVVALDLEAPPVDAQS